MQETEIRAGGVVCRHLLAGELPYPTPAACELTVIEPPNASSAERPEQMLGELSQPLLDTLLQRGGILLRGFGIDQARGFERVISGLRWARPMNGYFMAEPGRVLDADTQRVFHTNSYFKTGGGFSQLGSGFHSENYYSFDVPQFQAFWCGKPPLLGGETAICFMAQAFASLHDRTRAALTRLPTCSPRAWTLANVAARYGVPPTLLRAVAQELSLRLASAGGHEWFVLEKPTIVHHPHTGVPSLQVNLSRELPALTALLGEKFAPAYQHAVWAVHRAAWRSSTVLRVVEAAESGLGMIAAPYAGWRAVAGRRRVRAASSGAEPEPLADRARLADQVNADVLAELASALWRHCCVFTWRAGDVLLLDNFQMLHAGMPGFGARELRVMLLNSTLVSAADVILGRSVHDRLAL